MRITLFILLLIQCNTASSDNIRKWTDASGNIHYSDHPAPKNAINQEHIEINDSFDLPSYKAAIKRNKALYKEIRKIEKNETVRQKVAEKRLNDYFRYLDKKNKAEEKKKLKNRQYRSTERNRTSIKIKRSRSEKTSAEKKQDFKLK